jgi:hypothetical protein
MTQIDLDTLIYPWTRPQLLEDRFGKRWFFAQGSKGRFHELLTWQALNSLLAYHRLEQRRLTSKGETFQMQLIQNGQAVPQETYVRNGIVASKVSALLRDGATLIVNAIDDLHAPIASLVRQLETQLRAQVHANLYAAWRRDQGFEVHWDDHDVFILQIAGKTHWKVFGDTQRFPLERRSEVNKIPQ